MKLAIMFVVFVFIGKVKGDDDSYKLFANGTIFAKNTQESTFYIFDVYPVLSRRVVYEYKTIEDLCAALPRLEAPRLWNNYYVTSDLYFIPKTTLKELVELSEEELIKIESSCLSRKKIFQRLGDAIHPALKLP